MTHGHGGGGGGFHHHGGGGFHHHHGGFTHHHHHHQQSSHHHKHNTAGHTPGHYAHHKHHNNGHHKHHNGGHHGRHHHGKQHHHSSYNPWITQPAVLFPVVKARGISAKRTPPPRQQVVVIGGGQEPELGGVSVRMPAGTYLQERGVFNFAVDVIPDDGRAPWRVMRRYSEFKSLVSVVKTTSQNKHFPPKHRLKTFLGIPMNDYELEERRRDLESWLQDAIATQLARNGTLGSGQMRDFLLLCRSARPAALPELPQASAPPAEDEPLMLLAVDLPEGAGYGSLLTLTVEAKPGQGLPCPGRRNVTFAVPWGMTPGAPLELWYDPKAGTVGVHHQQSWQALRQP